MAEVVEMTAFLIGRCFWNISVPVIYGTLQTYYMLVLFFGPFACIYHTHCTS